MKILIQNAKLIQAGHPLNNKIINILIDNGKILQIGTDVQAGDCEVVKKDNLHVSPGWMDCFANFCDPGDEYNEDIGSGSRAAANGGFTDVMLVPNTVPVADTKSQIDYFLQKSKDEIINIHPIGAVTQGTEGKMLAEMYDMAHAGAIAFSDGTHPIQSAGVMLKALEYLLATDDTIIQLPNDATIGTHGQMNEGVISTQLGLPGMPAISEELMIARDIELVKYTGSRLHITGISTEKSVNLVRNAKANGLKISCSVTPYHLFFSEEDLTDYDTHLKVNPPLRSRADKDALIAGVNDGTIDFIASHHQPKDYDHKVCEFQHASFGMETLEVVFMAAITAGIPAELFVKMQTQNIRDVFGLARKEIKEGEPASLTLFTPGNGQLSVFEKSGISSKSHNNAFIHKELTGNIYGVVNKGKLLIK